MKTLLVRRGEAAEILGVDSRLITKLVRRRKLKGYRPTKYLAFLRADVEALKGKLK